MFILERFSVKLREDDSIVVQVNAKPILFPNVDFIETFCEITSLDIAKLQILPATQIQIHQGVNVKALNIKKAFR